MTESESTHDDAATGRVTTSAAEVYDTFFVPALFGQFADAAVASLALGHGDHVLDVGTGTGIVARAAAAAGADVVAVDPNPAMIAVARRHGVDVRRAAAERLPFDDETFDATVAQFVLMFCTNRARAVAELARTTRPGGRVLISTWADVAESPGYSAMVELLDDVIGPWAAQELLTPFTLGTDESIAALVASALPDVDVVAMPGTARFESLSDWLHTDIRGWTLADAIDDRTYAELERRATRRLERFVRPDGTVEFDAPAWFAVATVR